MTTEKNKWVDDVLGSADQMRRAQAPDMTGSVLSGINAIHSSGGMIWRIAASVIMLTALNVSVIYMYSSYRHTDFQGRSQDAAALFGLSADSHQTDIGTVFFGN